MVKEMTQFSVAQFDAFVAENRDPKTPCEKYMVAFKDATKQDLEPIAMLGGWSNIQRVRVLGDPYGIERYDFVPKLPPAVLAEKQRREERALQMTKAKEILNDPEKFRAYATAIISGAAAELLRESKNVAAARKAGPKKAPMSAVERRRFLASPEGKKAAYAEALRQDRQQRGRKPSRNPCADIKLANDLCPVSSAPGGGRFIANAKQVA